MPEEEQEQPPEIHDRNIYEVFIGPNDELMVEKQPMDSSIKDGAKLFINNNGRDGGLSDNLKKQLYP